MNLTPEGNRQAPEVDVEAEAVVIDNSFEPFKDLIKRRFLWYYDSYIATIAKEMQTVTENEPFAKMPFEHAGNTMDGKFRYPDLERRLKNIRNILDEETANWAQEGKEAAEKELGVAVNLRRQFEQTIEHYKKDGSVTIDIELVDNNPFLWRMVINPRFQETDVDLS